MYALIHDIFERQQEAPILRHVFVSSTKEGARHYYESHLKSDRFLKECEDKGKFDDRVPCRTRTVFVELTPAQVRALRDGTL